MAAARFVERLSEQIAYELAASQQYITSAVYFDAETLPRLAAFIYRQAEKRVSARAPDPTAPPVAGGAL